MATTKVPQNPVSLRDPSLRLLKLKVKKAYSNPIDLENNDLCLERCNGALSAASLHLSPQPPLKPRNDDNRSPVRYHDLHDNNLPELCNTRKSFSPTKKELFEEESSPARPEVTLSKAVTRSRTNSVPETSRCSDNYNVELPVQFNSMEVGLENLGNTCFMNSTLQCLLHIQPLVQFFLQGNIENKLNLASPKKGVLAASFYHLVREIYQRKAGSTVSPIHIQRAVGIHAPYLMDYQQQDSQEFLRFLLDGMSEDLCRKHSEEEEEDNQVGNTVIPINTAAVHPEQQQQQQQLTKNQQSSSNNKQQRHQQNEGGGGSFTTSPNSVKQLPVEQLYGSNNSNTIHSGGQIISNRISSTTTSVLPLLALNNNNSSNSNSHDQPIIDFSRTMPVPSSSSFNRSNSVSDNNNNNNNNGEEDRGVVSSISACSSPVKQNSPYNPHHQHPPIRRGHAAQKLRDETRAFRNSNNNAIAAAGDSSLVLLPMLSSNKNNNNNSESNNNNINQKRANSASNSSNSNIQQNCFDDNADNSCYSVSKSERKVASAAASIMTIDEQDIKPGDITTAAASAVASTSKGNNNSGNSSSFASRFRLRSSSNASSNSNTGNGGSSNNNVAIAVGVPVMMMVATDRLLSEADEEVSIAEEDDADEENEQHHHRQQCNEAEEHSNSSSKSEGSYDKNSSLSYSSRLFGSGIARRPKTIIGSSSPSNISSSSSFRPAAALRGGRKHSSSESGARQSDELQQLQQQQDAEDDNSHHSNSSSNNNNNNSDTIAARETAQKDANISWKKYLKLNDSIITDLFAGQLQSTIECLTCHTRSSSYDPFLDLSVPIYRDCDATATTTSSSATAPIRNFLGSIRNSIVVSSTSTSSPSSGNSLGIGGDANRSTIEKCLGKFTAEEILDGENMYTCEKCKKKRKSVKQMTIFKYPKVLVIHIKRFRFNSTRREKLSTDVHFPLTGLDLSPFISPDLHHLIASPPPSAAAAATTIMSSSSDSNEYSIGKNSGTTSVNDNSTTAPDRNITVVANKLETVSIDPTGNCNYNSNSRKSCNKNGNSAVVDVTTQLADTSLITALPPPVYDLIGVSNHHGNLHSGHYIAHVDTNSCSSNSNDSASAARWMCFNDARVSLANAASVAGPTAYVLFYKLRETPTRHMNNNNNSISNSREAEMMINTKSVSLSTQ